MLRISMLLPMSALLLTSACGVEIKLPDVCHTIKDQKIPGAPIAVEGTVAQRFAFDVSEKLNNGSVPENTEVTLSNVTLTLKSDVEDFSFLRAAELALLDGAAAATLASYVKSNVEVAARVVSLDGGSEDLAPALAKGPVDIELALTGIAPTVDWVMDLSACFSPTTRLIAEKTE